MKALVLTPKGPVLDQSLPDLQIDQPGQVLVRVRRAAICRTDLYVAAGKLPAPEGLILGHEIAGEVEAVSEDVPNLRRGDHVFVNPLLPCGRCAPCSAGDDHLCGQAGFMGLHFNGGFSDQVLTTADRVHLLDPELPFECGAYIEPVAAALAPLTALPSGTRVGVFGRNRIAALTMRILANAGHPAEPAEPGADPFPAVIETGLGSSLPNELIESLEPGGLLILKSRPAGPVSFPVARMVARRLRLEAVSYSPFAQAVDFVHRERDFLMGMAGNLWELASFEDAFRAALTSEDTKQFFHL